MFTFIKGSHFYSQDFCWIKWKTKLKQNDLWDPLKMRDLGVHISKIGWKNFNAIYFHCFKQNNTLNVELTSFVGLNPNLFSIRAILVT